MSVRPFVCSFMDLGILQATESSEVPLNRKFSVVLHFVIEKIFFLLDEKSGKVVHGIFFESFFLFFPINLSVLIPNMSMLKQGDLPLHCYV